MSADSSLSALTIGALALNPGFDAETLTYAATTHNATNKVTATAANEDSTVTLTLNGSEFQNGASATWTQNAENTLVITVTRGGSTKEYTVTVTHSTE